MSDVFISYSRRDKDFVGRLRTALVASDRDTWVDWEDIPLTVDWWREICAGIEAADSFVFIISPDSVASAVCNLEIAYATQHNKRLIPVVRVPADENAAFASLAARPVDDHLRSTLAGRDLVTLARENWQALARHNWLFFADDTGFDENFRKLLNALDTDFDHVRAHTRLIVRSNEWERSGRNASFLLRGDDLLNAEKWQANAADQEPAPTELQAQYILASRQAAIGRQRVTLVGVSVALVVALGLAVLALLLARQSEERRVEADDNYRTAVAAQLTSAANANTAVFAQGLAQDSAATSDASYQIAVAAQATSDQNAAEARSLALAASARQTGNSGNGDLALALALAANDIDQPPARSQEALNEIAFAPGTRFILNGHESAVTDVAFSADGTRAATASLDGRIILWDVETGEQQFTLDAVATTGRVVPFQTVAFSPDGKTLAAGSGDGISLWNLASRSVIHSMNNEHNTFINSVQFSHDGRRLLTAGKDHLVTLWDVDPASPNYGQELRRFEGHTDEVNSASFSPDETLIVSAGDDDQIILWDAATGAEIHRFIGHTDNVHTALFSPDGRWVISGSLDATIRVWDTATGAELRNWSLGFDQPTSLAFQPEGTVIAAGSSGGTILLMDPNTGQINTRLNGHDSEVTALEYSPDGRYLLSGSFDLTARLWYAGGATELHRLVGHQGKVNGLAVTSDGKHLYSVSADTTLLEWDLATGTVLRRLVENTAGSLYDLALSPDEQTLLSSGTDSTVRQWELASGRELRRIDLRQMALWQGYQIVRLSFNADGSRVVLVAYDYTPGSNNSGVIVWDMTTWSEVWHLQTNGIDEPLLTGAVFSPDGQRLLVIGGVVTDAFSGISGQILVFDTSTWQQVTTLTQHNNQLFGIAFSPDGRYFATGSLDRKAVLWDAVSLTPIREFVGHSEGVTRVRFSPDGRYLLTISNDHSVILWNVGTGALINRFIGHSDVVRDAVFNPDGRTVISGASDQTIRIWQMPLPLNELKQWIIDHRFVPEFTCDQRVQFELTPLCDSAGAAPTRTAFPTLTPTMTLTASLTPDLTRTTATPTLEPLHPTATPTLVVSWTPSATLTATPTSTATPVPLSDAQLQAAVTGLDFTVLVPHGFETLADNLVLENATAVNTAQLNPDDLQFIFGSHPPQGDLLVLNWKAEGFNALITESRSPYTRIQEWVDDTITEAVKSGVINYIMVDGVEIAVTDMRLVGGVSFGFIDHDTLVTILISGRNLPDAETVVPLFTRGELIEPVSTATPVPGQSAMIGEQHGEIAVGGGESWTYAGKAGEHLTITVWADHPAGANTTTEERLAGGLLDSLVRLYAPDGSLLAEGDDNDQVDETAPERTNSRIDWTLPADGVYRIEVRSYDNQSGGGYTLVLTRG